MKVEDDTSYLRGGMRVLQEEKEQDHQELKDVRDEVGVLAGKGR